MSDPAEDGRSWRGALATMVLLSIGCLASSAVWAQTEASGARTQTYHISAQALSTALQQFAAQSGVQLLFSESDVAGMKTAGLQGSFTKDEAIQRLLAGSGLVFEFPKPDAVIIRRPTSPTESTSTRAPGAAPTAQSSSGSYSTPAQSYSKAQGPHGVSSPGSQAAQTASTSDIEQVIVTGRAGVEERTKAQTSYSVTTIDETRLRLQGPTSVTESLKSVPGFWVEASGGEASGNVRARGIPVDGFGSINLLEDGMPVQHDPALGYLNGDQAFRLDETIDRLEVVRGGPSTIFYSNAPAGAVNYIPRRVGDHEEGLLKYTVGDYGLNRIDAWAGAPIGDWKMSMGGFYRYDNGVRNPGFHGDNGGQFRLSIGRDFERGKVWFDFKRLDDTVFLDLGIPMKSDSSGHLHAVPGFDGNFGTLAGPETAYIRMTTALANNVPGSSFLFDNKIGTQVKRTQASLSFDFEIADGYTLTDKVRYDDTGTVRNGVYPNTLQSATSFISGLPKSLLSTYPGTAALQLRYTDSGAIYDLLHQNGNGLITVGGLRSVTSPIKEFMNDARLSHQFEFGGTHDATLGYYVADVSQDFSRYSSTALLDVEDNARLLDLEAVNAAGNVLGPLTDHGIYHYGYEWANSNGESTTTAFYLSDEWQLTDRLRIDVGTRYEQVHLTSNVELRQTVSLGTPATSQILTGTGQFVSFDQRFSHIGETIGANYQFTDHSGVFARYSPAFRLPNLGTYTTASLSSNNPTVTRPITQTMYLGELGYKYANAWTDAYVTAFWTKYDDVGFTDTVFNLNTSELPTQVQRYADTRTYGLELEGGFYPIEWFDLTYNATLEQPKYVGLRYTDNVNGKPVYRDYNGNQLIRVPKTSIRVVPGVNLFNRRLRLQVAWEFEGARYVDIANSVVLPHYDTLNFSGRLSITDNFDVYAYVDNVTNSQGLTEGNPRLGEVQSADAGANTFIARPILGRAVRASLMYRF